MMDRASGVGAGFQRFPDVTNNSVKVLLKEGVEAKNSGNYKVARQKLWVAAVSGEPNAYFHLGQMCERGEGVDKDQNAADECYKRASKIDGKEDSPFRLNTVALGFMYERGIGMEKPDYVRAKGQYLIAGGRGDGWAYAQAAYLIEYYPESKGDTPHLAHSYYEKALDSGTLTEEQAIQVRQKIDECISKLVGL